MTMSAQKAQSELRRREAEAVEMSGRMQALQRELQAVR